MAEPSPPPPPPNPSRIQIPALNLDAAVEQVGVERSGAMATPQNIWNVGWYAAGPAPGAAGDAVIDGHVGLPGQPLIFTGLARLRVGDLITVIATDGSKRAFSVTSNATWPADSHPPGLFDIEGAPRLTLITCGGAYLPRTQKYADRVIVEAALTGVGG